MKEIEWAELRINDGDGGDYLNIYSDDKTYSYLLEDVFERMNETDIARITAERDAFKSIVEEVMEAFQIHKLPKVLQAVKSDYDDALKGEYKGKGDLTEEERAALKDSM